MRTAGWVQVGLGVATALAAIVLWRTHSDEIRDSEEAKVARSVANAGLEPLGQRIPPPAETPSATIPADPSAPVRTTTVRQP